MGHHKRACADGIESSVGLFYEVCVAVASAFEQLIEEADRPARVANEETKEGEHEGTGQLLQCAPDRHRDGYHDDGSQKNGVANTTEPDV